MGSRYFALPFGLVILLTVYRQMALRTLGLLVLVMGGPAVTLYLLIALVRWQVRGEGPGRELEKCWPYELKRDGRRGCVSHSDR